MGLGQGLLQVTVLFLESFDPIGGGIPYGLPGQPVLAGFEERFGPLVI